jgi:LAS superfamily LD-carboxypeptidase LdcB
MGWVNGELGAQALVDVDGCTMVPAAAEAWRVMRFVAAAEGVALRSSQCYRSIGGQVAARDSWCATEERCQFAAQPGRSLHGWGLAVDVTAGGHAIDFDSPEYAWLAAHAAEYGFYHPEWADPTGDAPEPWHWEYQAPL